MWGRVVADEDIKHGEFVIEYVGEVIDDKTCEERLWKMKHHGEINFYLCEINRDMVIDAMSKGNKSRYINHSCCPNTEMQKWIIDGETRIGIFALRDIKKGEPLTYDYHWLQAKTGHQTQQAEDVIRCCCIKASSMPSGSVLSDIESCAIWKR